MKHERALVSRRELLGLFGAGVLAARGFAAQDQEPRFLGIDHFEFFVSNVEKSRDFFVRLFGNTLLSRNNKRYLKLGSAYMAFEAPRGGASAAQVDHVSLAIKDLDMMKLHALLQQRGAAYQDYPSGRDTAVLDPEGTRLQLSPENGWSMLNPATFLPENVALTEKPVFTPVGLNQVTVNVTDLQKSVAHYEKLLGPPLSWRSDTVTFTIAGPFFLSLSSTPAGQRPGFRTISIQTEYFEANAMTGRLRQMGMQGVSSDSQSAVRFQDPDGLQLQAQWLYRI